LRILRRATQSQATCKRHRLSHYGFASVRTFAVASLAFTPLRTPPSSEISLRAFLLDNRSHAACWRYAMKRTPGLSYHPQAIQPPNHCLPAVGALRHQQPATITIGILAVPATCSALVCSVPAHTHTRARTHARPFLLTLCALAHLPLLSPCLLPSHTIAIRVPLRRCAFQPQSGQRGNQPLGSCHQPVCHSDSQRGGLFGCQGRRSAGRQA